MLPSSRLLRLAVLAEYRGRPRFHSCFPCLPTAMWKIWKSSLGKKVTVKALEVDKSRRRIVASRRQEILTGGGHHQARKEKYKQPLKHGQRGKGHCTPALRISARFTDIGGVDGLIHVTDLSWGRPKHPSDIVSVGDELELEILSVNAETERIALSLKALQPKPWDHRRGDATWSVTS